MVHYDVLIKHPDVVIKDPGVVIKVNASKDGDKILPPINCCTCLYSEIIISKNEFTLHEHMLTWARTKDVKLGFVIVIEISDSGFHIRQTFVTMRCERIFHYKEPIKKLKHGDTRTRKYGCPFKLCGYHKMNNNGHLM